MKIGQKVVGYLLAVASTYLIGVLLVTQFNISQVTQLGPAVSLTSRAQTVLHDWLGMLEIYLPLIAIAMFTALLVTGLVLNRFLPRSAWLYALAGLVAMVALHQIMNLVFEISAVAPTRTSLGLLAQGLAGAIGGYTFERFAFPKPQQQS